MTSWLVPLDTLARRRGGDDPRAVGGKAAGLAWLVRHEFPVPDAWVLPADAFGAAIRELPPGCEPRSLLRAANGRAGYVRAAEARQEILAAPFPKGLDEEIEALWAREAPRAPWGFAVRSSATCEDGALVSMAGLAESKVGARGPEELADAIRAVWASIASRARTRCASTRAAAWWSRRSRASRASRRSRRPASRRWTRRIPTRPRC